MKKSTILLVLLTYIISFFLVGIFGIAIRGFKKDVYVERINIICPEQGLTIEDLTDKTQDPITEYKFRTQFKDGGITVLLKGEVVPEDATEKDFSVEYDSNQTVYTIEIVDIYYIQLHFNEKGTAKFSVVSNDGTNVRSSVQFRAKA